MPDIHSSWQFFKISWLKRLLDTKAMWGEIFDLNLAKLMPGYSRVDIATFFGTKDLIKLQKKFPSRFWSECLISLIEFLLIFIRHNPQSIINCHIWNSHIFMRNNAMCGRGTFRSLYEKNQISSRHSKIWWNGTKLWLMTNVIKNMATITSSNIFH